MEDLKKFAIGTIITLVVGGTAYSFTQEDVINNFAQDTGLSQEQAARYVSGMSEDELDTWENVGDEMMKEGQEVLIAASEIDCINYEYEWQSATLSCSQGKTQLTTLGQSSLDLGRSYIRLSSENATPADMQQTIQYIDALNATLRSEIVIANFTQADIEYIRNGNSYNKAVLQAALGSEN